MNNKNEEVNRNVFDKSGLLGYYFSDSNFENPVLYAPTRGGKLRFDITTESEGLFTENNSNYKSIKWFGYLKSNVTGDYKFKISDDLNAIIEVNGKIVSSKGENKETVHLEKGQLIEIKIEYQNEKGLDAKDKVLESMELIKIDKDVKEIKIEQSELQNPDYSDHKKTSLVARSLISNLFKGPDYKMDIRDLDTDRDTIPDAWEISGYTIKENKLTKWEDKFASQGYTKFVSNPYDAYTVGDPYTDYEKAAKIMPRENNESSENPVVAAYPSVNVSMESMYLSLNETMSNQVDSYTSNNWSHTNTWGAEINTGFSVKDGFSFGVSASYSHSSTNGSEWGNSNSFGTTFNDAQRSFFNANVRYNNVGTGAIYHVQPTTNFILNGKSFATITAKSNAEALSIAAGESYPKKGLTAILLNGMDDFNSNQGIALNSDQTDAIVDGETVKVETSQTNGKYGLIDESGKFVMGESWNGVTGQIEGKTASIIVDAGDKVKESRIYAKSYTNPELNNAPSITVREALKLGFPNEVKEKNGLLYYNDKPIFESSVMTYVDEFTSKQIKKQIDDKTGQFKNVNTIYDVKLEPKMNFTIKLAKWFDSAEDGATNTWYYTYRGSGGVTGKKQFYVGGTGSNGYCNLSNSLIEDQKQYFVSLYMKSNGDTKATVELGNGSTPIVSKDVNLNDSGYQRIDIPINNSKRKQFNRISVKTNGGKRVYWDDVSISEVSKVKTLLDEDYVKSFYKNVKVHSKAANGIKQIIFTNNMTEIRRHITKYRVKNQGMRGYDSIRPSYVLDPDKTLRINFEEYNGWPISLGNYVTIYAISKDGKWYQVLKFRSEDPLEILSDEDYVKPFYKNVKVHSKSFNGIRQIRFTDNMTEMGEYITKYRVRNQGWDAYDITRPSYGLDPDKTLRINFEEYNGQSIPFGNIVTIYAISNGGKEYEVLKFKSKDPLEIL